MSPVRRRLALLLASALTVLTVLVTTGALDSFDRWAERALPPDHAAGLVGVTQALGDAIAAVASPRVVVSVTVLVALLLDALGRPSAVRTVVPAVVIGAASVLALKVAVARPGPPGSHAVQLLGWYPSGHTATSLVCAGALASLGGRRWARAAAAWTLLVAATMVWVHAHWVTDVVGGALLGGLVLVLVLPPTPRVSRPAAPAPAHRARWPSRAPRRGSR